MTGKSLDAGHYPPGFSIFRVEWERATWAHAGDPRAGAREKQRLLRWRLHLLLARLTGDLSEAYECVLARPPDLPSTQAALGATLVRAGQPKQAISHLHAAVEGLPFDRDAARCLAQALDQMGDTEGRARLARERRLLAKAAPKLVPSEPWFAEATAVSARETPPPAQSLIHIAQAACRPGRNKSPPKEPTEGTGPEAVAGSVTPLLVQTAERVALCMIVKDAEKELAACLASAADLVHQIVVVDTGSADRTREVARQFGASVFGFPWVDDFAAARNESLRQATAEWVFWMDADERLDEENRQRLRRLLAGLPGENVAYLMKQKSRPTTWGSSALVADQARLFRRHPALRWQYRVHEQILPAVHRLGGRVCWTDVVIQHDGYEGAALRQRKQKRNLRLLERDLAEHPEDSFVLFNLGWLYQEMGRVAESLPLLRRSLERVPPDATIVRKLYVLLARGHHALNQRPEALAACREGRARYPDDVEILQEEAVLLCERGDLAGAEKCLLRLLEAPPKPYFVIGLDPGLRGYQTWYKLGVIYRDQGKPAAEVQWRAVLSECPEHGPAWIGLADLLLAQGRGNELEETARRLETTPDRSRAAALV